MYRFTALFGFHYAHFAAQTAIARYLARNIESFLVIRHRVAMTGEPCTQGVEYKSGRRIRGTKLKFLPAAEFAKKSNTSSYEFVLAVQELFFSLIITLSYLRRAKQRLTIAFGADPLTGAFAILLKKLHLARWVVIAFAEHTAYRFSNPAMNSLYLSAYNSCALNSDCILVQGQNIAARMRVKFGDIDIFLLPNGTYLPKNFPDKREENSLVFCGMLGKTRGEDLLVETIPYVLREIPDVTLHIIGSGPNESYVKRLASRLGVESRVKFHGYQSHDNVMALLPRFSIGIAPYVPNILRVKAIKVASSEFQTLSFPTSVVEYLACGLPIITTRGLGEVDAEVVNNDLGMVTNFDVREVAECIVKMSKDKAGLKRMSENAMKYAERYEWNSILERALRDICKFLELRN